MANQKSICITLSTFQGHKNINILKNIAFYKQMKTNELNKNTTEKMKVFIKPLSSSFKDTYIKEQHLKQPAKISLSLQKVEYGHSLT